MNLTINETDVFDGIDVFGAFTRGLYTYVIPIISIFGILGNVLSFRVFVFTSFGYHSSSVYIAVLSISDTAFLASLLISWLGGGRIGVLYVHSPVWCQVMIYVTYVCSFLSVWYVVLIMIDRLQNNYMEVPGTVSITAKEVYNHFYTACTTTISDKIFGQITKKIFGNVNVIKHNGLTKYAGLRPNLLENKPCSIEIIKSLASNMGYFIMPVENCLLKLGFATGYCTNSNEIIKVLQIFNDKTYKISVGGRNVDSEEIGLNGLSFHSYMDTKTILNTFRQCILCQGKSVKSKTDTNKFSVVQEWNRIGDENNLELKRTARKCRGVVPFAYKSMTCKQCNNQKGKDQRLDTSTHETTDDLFHRLFPGSNDLMLKFMKIQSDMSCETNDKRSRRWNKEIIQVCLSLWNRSPEAYSSLRNSGLLILPSESLLSRYKNCLQQRPGINEEMFLWMKNESENLKTENFGGLILDEMSVQEDLKMSFANGSVSIDGLVEMGQFVEDMALLNTHKHETRTATHVMQFIFLGYDGFRFPIAYYPTASANASELYDMVWQVMNKLIEYEFYTDYVCFDGCSNNRTFQMIHFNDMQDARERDFTIVSPYYPSQRVTFMMDYSHNIKKLRNSIHSSGNSNFSKRKLTRGDQFIIWDFWVDAYTWDKQFNTPIRIHQKLTDEHIFLNKTSKMRNHLADQVLDKDMLNLMLKYKLSLINGSHLEMTIELLKHTSKVIDIFRDHRPVADVHDNRLFDLLLFEKWLDEWSNSIDKCENQSASEKKKMFITRETYSDMISMIHGFISICKRRILRHAKSVTPAGVNSDVVENFFCMQRTINHGSNCNPTVHQYKYAINATVLGQNAVSKKSNAANKRKSCKPFNFTCPKPLNKKHCIRL